MTKEPRPAPFFVADHPALDFLNSVATPRATTFDWLETPPDLLDWFVAAGLATESEIKPFRAASAATALERAHVQVTAFRETLRAFVAERSGTALETSAHPILAEINQVLHQAVHFPQLEPRTDAGGYLMVLKQPLEEPSDLLVRIAAAAARLITDADFRYVRNCEGPTCTLYFLDTSKNHKRRWCSMEVCGNRAKAAAFRKR